MLATILTIIVAFLLIIVLGVITAFSPTLFFTELAILTRSKNAFRQTVIFLCGIATPIVLLVILYTLVLSPSESYTLHIELPTVKQVVSAVPLLTLLVGLLCIGAGIKLRFFRKRDKAAKPPRITIMRSGLLYWFGCLHMGLSLSTVAGVLVSIHVIKFLLPSATLQTIAFVWLIAMVMLPFVTIMALYFFWPQTFTRIQAASDRLAAFNYYPLASYTFTILGLTLVLLALMTKV